MERAIAANKDSKIEDNEDKTMLGGLIPTDVYWKFKREAAKRKEKMADALLSAVMLYLEFEENMKEQKQAK